MTGINTRTPTTRTNSSDPATTTTSGGTTNTAGTGEAASTSTVTATSAVTEGTHSDGVDRTERPGVVRRTFDKAVDKVKVMTLDEIRKEHSVGASVGPVGIKLSEDIINPEHQTALQKQTAERIQAETGKDVVWLKTQVAVHAGSHVARGLPGLPASAGFAADGYLVYETTQPYTVTAEDKRKLTSGTKDVVKQVFKDYSVDLPLKSDAAFAMEPGSSWKVTGRGTASASVGASSSSLTPLAGPVGLAASVSASVSSGTEKMYELKGEALDNGFYASTLTELDGKSRSASLQASVGLQVGDGPVEDELFAKVPSLRNQKLGDHVGGLAADKVADLVNKLKISATVSSGTYENDRQIAVSVYDTKNPNAAANYDKGILLNDKALERASQHPEQSGVQRITATGETSSTAMMAKIEFFDKKLLLKRLTATNGELHVRTPDGHEAWLRRSDFDRHGSNIITGSQQTNWDAAYLMEKDPQGNIKETPYLNVRNNMDDTATFQKEMAHYKNFAREFGVDLSDAPEFEGRVLFSAKDNTERSYDVVYSQQGMHNILDATHGPEAETKLLRAHAAATATVKPELSRITELVNVPAAMQAAREYQQLKQTPGNDPEDTKKQDTAIREFYRAAQDAGVDIRWGDSWGYAEAVGDAGRFSDNMRSLGESSEQGQWVGKLNTMLQKYDYENLPEVLALSRMAGMDETVASVRVKYYGREYGVQENGAPAHPSTVTDHMLDPSSHTRRPD
ncbi:MAG: hypothetical protein ABIJ09_01105 [Pseudomonadota bacterium]